MSSYYTTFSGTTSTTSSTSSGMASTSSYSSGSTITSSGSYTTSGTSSSSSSSISSGIFSSGTFFSGSGSENIFGSSNDFSFGESSDQGGMCYDWITYRGFKIADPFLVPLCLWALYIGISKFRLFRKFNDTSIYAITFFMYGIMMTFAMCADSLSSNFSESAKVFVTIADVDLTSTIGTFFLYCGLSDLGLINPKSFRTKLVLLFNSIVLLISWIYAIKYAGSKTVDWFLILYEGVVSVSCLLYLILQMVYLNKNKRTKSILWLLAAGVCGGIGLMCTLLTHKFCLYFGANFTSSYAWFFLSDVAMLLIAKYVVVSRDNDKLTKKYNKCCFSKKSSNHNNQQDDDDEESNLVQYQPIIQHQQQQQQQQQQPVVIFTQPIIQPQPIILQSSQGGYILLHTQQPQQPRIN